jgi:hypothetical protein
MILSRVRPLLLLATTIVSAGALGGCSSSGVEPRVDPATEIGTTEREREMKRTLDQPLGFLNVPLIRSRWVLTDLSDSVTGAPQRYAQMMETKGSPDQRREGMMGLVDRPWGERPPYTTRYAQIAEERDGAVPADYLLRASAIRSLNRSREPGHANLFIKGLADESEWVRLESAKALNRLPAAEAIPALLSVVSKPEENKDVRIAAAEALGHHKNFEVARALISLLGSREFGLAWQAHQSLTQIMPKDLGYDEGAWLNYLNSPEKPLG